MIRLAVFGQPVGQSLSPRIHGLFADQFGLSLEYQAIEATRETFENAVAELAQRGGVGCNITMPFKRQAWELASQRSNDADRAEAVNTLHFRDDGWFGDNTDGEGLVGDLERVLALRLSRSRICLLGAGGAARGVLAALQRRDPKEIVVANRSADKACALARKNSDLGRVSATGLDGLGDAPPFDLVINATSLGHRGRAPELPAGLFTDEALCYDMNYGAAAAPLARLCSDRGVRYSDGLGMLVGQAALSFRLWTGDAPDPAPVLAVLREVG